MMKNFQYYVEAGAGADANGANFTSIGTANDSKIEFYNFVDRTETVKQARDAGLVGKPTFSYNLAEDPKNTTGASNVSIAANATQGDSATLFGSLSGNAKNTLQLPACTVVVPNVAINKTGPTELLITLEDRTVFKAIMSNPDATTANGTSPLGHGGEMGGRERASRLAGRF
jgi:hypothetical protein